MAKGVLFTAGNQLFKATTPEAKEVFKSIAKGNRGDVMPSKEIGPVFDIDTLKPEEAERALLDIVMAEGK
ncbi:MAG: hypothetical protein WCV62_05895 [Candidatus Peribacteraceae bacterium]|jgi:hypothetical protein